ncbi:MAG: ABC transporter permease [Acidobacteria bacterium]|nr:ABC transporter permease [Acidobacteriota bacterium]
MHIDDYVRSGLAPEEARRRALHKLGGVEKVTEAYREQRGLPFLETLAQDVRFAFRGMRKNLGFTSIALLTLALGIGANTALFSVVNGVLLNPLPYPESGRLTMVYSSTKTFEHSSVSYPNFLDWQRQNNSFSTMAAFRDHNWNLTGQSEAERLHGYMVSSSFFPTLGVAPLLGRNISADEDRVGGAPVLMIGYGLWQRKFGGSPDVLGRRMILNGEAYTIVGVVPANFRLYSSDNVQIYVPIGQWNDSTFRNRRVGMGTRVVARLKPGVTLDQARADMDSVARSLATLYPESNAGSGVSISTLKNDMVEDIGPTLLVLLAAVGFVLLIACTNVANLLLARSTGRSREFAVRSAMGASQSRLVRQLLTESTLLGLIGGGVGLLLAAEGTKPLLAAVPHALPRAAEIGVDGRVLLFTLGMSVAAGMLFGLVNALKVWRTNLQETLKEGGRGSSGTRQRAQNVFVVVEMAVALVLLVGSGLMIRSLVILLGVNPGFDTHNVLKFNVTMPPNLGTDPAHIRAALRQLHDAVRNTPGVQAASLEGDTLPMDGDSELPFWLDGQPKPATDSEMNWGLFYLAEPDYRKALGIPLLRGRFFTDADTERSVPVVVIDEFLANKFFPNGDALGKRLNLGLFETQPEIVGIVGHVKHWGLDTDSKSKIQAQLYVPVAQVPDQFMPLVRQGMGMVLRSDVEPMSLLPAIRHSVSQLSKEQVVYGSSTLEQVVSDSLADRRFAMVLLGAFAGLALLLSSIGIYGVISYLVGQRVQEIGTRMALGAQRRDVLQLVLGRGMALAAIGVVVGAVLAFALTRQMRSMIYGVSAADPITFLAVSLLLMLVAVAACYVPARRAMRVDPMMALRYE